MIPLPIKISLGDNLGKKKSKQKKVKGERIYCPVSKKPMGKGKSGQNNLDLHLKLWKGKISKQHRRCLEERKENIASKLALVEKHGVEHNKSELKQLEKKEDKFSKQLIDKAKRQLFWIKRALETGRHISPVVERELTYHDRADSPYGRSGKVIVQRKNYTPFGIPKKKETMNKSQSCKNKKHNECVFNVRNSQINCGCKCHAS